ncbi:hypothetical protein, partial [Gulbenkiania mobilis]|uniref:hypothetical protein n=1 Tax=Gulbenkiania mobilis TaxID=397457 RepID=UPI0013792711
DITVLHTDTFVPLVAKLKERRKAGLTRVTLATKSAETSMPSRVDALLDQFLSDTRAAVYHRIDEGISNDKFRMVLEAQIESG